MKPTILIDQQSLCSVAALDTSFLDRLLNWQFFYKISQHLNCSISVPTFSWPEVLFLNLPNTENVDNVDITQYQEVDLETLILGVLGKVNLFENNNQIYLKYTTSELRSSPIFKQTKLFNPILKLIKFKKNEVNKFFIKNFSNTTSMQLRRGIGTYPSKQYINELKEYVDYKSLKNYYFNSFLLNSHPLYPIEPDSTYFRIIKDILKYQPDQKIYLSYDVPKKFIQHYLDKYPKNIVTRDDYLEEYLSYFEEFDLKSKKCYRVSLRHTLKILLDFFAIAYSCKIFSRVNGEYQSGWIHFASYYRTKKQIYYI